ncbi:MAG: hypothetical protein IIA45_12485 [Bacteroidetes bacterium]|nr:hypothetical protein [Bacteroidota bacterium]
MNNYTITILNGAKIFCFTLLFYSFEIFGQNESSTNDNNLTGIITSVVVSEVQEFYSTVCFSYHFKNGNLGFGPSLPLNQQRLRNSEKLGFILSLEYFPIINKKSVTLFPTYIIQFSAVTKDLDVNFNGDVWTISNELFLQNILALSLKFPENKKLYLNGKFGGGIFHQWRNYSNGFYRLFIEPTIFIELGLGYKFI